MFPIYKIETWSGGNKTHTITDEAISIYTKQVVTDGVGSFKFVVPTVKGIPNPYYYGDVNIGDTVKIWVAFRDKVGYGGASGLTTDPQLVGTVNKITAPLSTQTGWTREFSGKALGEVLLRQIKRDKYWNGVTATSLVTDVANDLSLGTGEIENDTNVVSLLVNEKRYFDILKYVSDYWVDASHQIMKDFYVDANNNLVWKSRPFRTSNVDTITVGENVLRYNVVHDVLNVANSITVYGAKNKTYPPGVDDWGESTSGWSGTNAPTTNADCKVGNYSIEVAAANTYPSLWRTISCGALFDSGYDKLRFWFKEISGSGVNISGPFTVYLYSYLSGPLYAYYLGGTDYTPQSNQWYQVEVSIGPKSRFTSAGVGATPDWNNLIRLEFTGQFDADTATNKIRVDAPYFHGAPWANTTSDTPSINSYGERNLVVKDESLQSDSDCQSRAQTLVYQKKDPPTQITVAVLPGSNNLLVGDRLSMTIPAEGITAQNYDVLSVEHNFNKQTGFTSVLTLVNSVNIREPVVVDSRRVLVNLQRTVQALNRGELNFK
jgi:hypothetical protein